MSARLALVAQLSLRMDAIPAHRLIREHRDEVLDEAAEFLLAARVARPVGEAEEHMNQVLTSLAAEVRTLAPGGAR
ncbi:hypothetical protein ACWGLE_01370 [Streptomyces sp. NPDC055897]